jgi:hypothetical protein
MVYEGLKNRKAYPMRRGRTQKYAYVLKMYGGVKRRKNYRMRND